MKTYTLFYAFLLCTILSCSKSSNPSDEIDQTTEGNSGADASYNLLVKDEGLVSSVLIDANAKIATVNPAASAFKTITDQDLIYNVGSVYTAYHKSTSCSGIISRFDFTTNTLIDIKLFSDMSACDLEVLAIANSDSKFYLSYHLIDSEDYFVRIIDSNLEDGNFIDVALKEESYDPTFIPKELVFANNKLFILCHDEETTDEYHLMVMDGGTKTMIKDVNLGFNVQQIFKSTQDNIIVSYENLHSELNSNTMAIKYTNYNEGSEPNFINSKYNYFDKDGKMYYEMPPGYYSEYATIPAVYDFSKQMATIYAYENFLTKEQYNIEFEIEETTMVGYDDKNDYILIGYKKIGNDNKGGLLRIKPAPDPAFIDNLDISGVPYKIFTY